MTTIEAHLLRQQVSICQAALKDMIGEHDRIVRALRRFAAAPLSASSLQPILDLAAKFSPRRESDGASRHV